MRTAIVCLLAVAPLAHAELPVVTTTPNLAYLTNRIGGEHVHAVSIMRGPEDVHHVQAKPSHMMKLRKAQLFIHSGLDAEPWAIQLIKGARNPNLLLGEPGNVDTSHGVTVMEVPSAGQLTRALGDIHAYGNTHYMLDPLNGLIAAGNIRDALKRTTPEHAEVFDANFAALEQDIHTLVERLKSQLQPYQGAKVVTYHRTWTYFLTRFGLTKIAEVEPKPGISPGPQHLTDCVNTMKSQSSKVVIVETYNSLKNATFVADQVGGQAVVLASEVKGLDNIDSYEQLFEHNVNTLIGALSATQQTPEN